MRYTCQKIIISILSRICIFLNIFNRHYYIVIVNHEIYSKIMTTSEGKSFDEATEVNRENLITEDFLLLGLPKKEV